MKSMLSLEFWGAKKEAPEARKQEFVLSLEFLAAKWAVVGSPGGRKEHFYHVFKQNLQKGHKIVTPGFVGVIVTGFAPHTSRAVLV